MDINQNNSSISDNITNQPTPVFLDNPGFDNSNPKLNNTNDSPLNFFQDSEVLQDRQSPQFVQPQDLPKNKPINPTPVQATPEIDFSKDQTYVVDNNAKTAKPLDQHLSDMKNQEILTPTNLVSAGSPQAVNPNLQVTKQEQSPEIKDTNFSKNKKTQLSYFKALLIIGPIFLAICLGISFYVVNSKLDKPLETLLMMATS